MLSILNPESTLHKYLNMKCAEVFCQTLEHFSIVCTFCEMKSFDFEDFLLHFKNVHLDNSNLSEDLTIKRENVVVASEYGDGVPEDNGQVDSKQELAVSSESADTSEHFPSRSGVQVKLSAWSDDNFSDADSKSDFDATNWESGDKAFLPKIAKNPSKATSDVSHQCGECGKSYKMARSLEHHMEKCHGKDVGHKCSHCDSVFRSERTLSSHVQSVHDGFACDQCDKTYKSKEALQLHAHNHSGVRSFVCDVENCGKAFFNRKYLSRHKRNVHTLESNFICEMCGYRTKVKPALVVHKRTHTGEKPYPCNMCDKRFASHSLLKEHKAIHSSERPHICDVCGAAFSRQKALYHHKHLHLSVKKFKCKICGNAYAQAAGLAGHMRKHRSEQQELQNSL